MKTTLLLLSVLLAVFVTTTAFFMQRNNNKKDDDIYLKKIVLHSMPDFNPVAGDNIYMGVQDNWKYGKITTVEKGDQYDLVLIDLGSQNAGSGYSSLRIESSEKLGKKVIRLVPSKKLLKPHQFIALILLHE